MPPLKVAIVENDEDIQLLYRMWFQDLDEYQIFFLPIDSSLFDAETWKHVDRIILDLSLHSEVTGIDVAKWLYLNIPSLPVIVATAHIYLDEQVKIMLSSRLAWAVLRKPFTWEELRSALDV